MKKWIWLLVAIPVLLAGVCYAIPPSPSPSTVATATLAAGATKLTDGSNKLYWATSTTARDAITGMATGDGCVVLDDSATSIAFYYYTGAAWANLTLQTGAWESLAADYYHFLEAVNTTASGFLGTPTDGRLMYDATSGLWMICNGSNCTARTIAEVEKAQTLTNKTLTSPVINGGTGTSLTMTEAIAGLLPLGSDITTGSNNITAAQTRGFLHRFTGAATAVLPTAASAGFGAAACFKIRDAAEEAIVDLQSAEVMNLRGTAQAAGVGIKATGVGEYVCVVATTDADGSGTDGWETMGTTSGWASQ